ASHVFQSERWIRLRSRNAASVNLIALFRLLALMNGSFHRTCAHCRHCLQGESILQESRHSQPATSKPSLRPHGVVWARLSVWGGRLGGIGRGELGTGGHATTAWLAKE